MLELHTELTYFSQCSISVPPENVKENLFGFLTFSGGIEIEYWNKMGGENCDPSFSNLLEYTLSHIPANIYLVKVNDKNTRKMG